MDAALCSKPGNVLPVILSGSSRQNWCQRVDAGISVQSIWNHYHAKWHDRGDAVMISRPLTASLFATKSKCCWPATTGHKPGDIFRHTQCFRPIYCIKTIFCHTVPINTSAPPEVWKIFMISIRRIDSRKNHMTGVRIDPV